MAQTAKSVTVKRLLCALLGHRRVMVVDRVQRLTPGHPLAFRGAGWAVTAMHPACSRCGVELVDNLHDSGFQVKR